MTPKITPQNYMDHPCLFHGRMTTQKATPRSLASRGRSAWSLRWNSDGLCDGSHEAAGGAAGWAAAAAFSALFFILDFHREKMEEIWNGKVWYKLRIFQIQCDWQRVIGTFHNISLLSCSCLQLRRVCMAWRRSKWNDVLCSLAGQQRSSYEQKPQIDLATRLPLLLLLLLLFIIIIITILTILFWYDSEYCDDLPILLDNIL